MNIRIAKPRTATAIIIKSRCCTVWSVIIATLAAKVIRSALVSLIFSAIPFTTSFPSPNICVMSVCWLRICSRRWFSLSSVSFECTRSFWMESKISSQFFNFRALFSGYSWDTSHLLHEREMVSGLSTSNSRTRGFSGSRVSESHSSSPPSVPLAYARDKSSKYHNFWFQTHTSGF